MCDCVVSVCGSVFEYICVCGICGMDGTMVCGSVLYVCLCGMCVLWGGSVACDMFVWYVCCVCCVYGMWYVCVVCLWGNVICGYEFVYVICD